MFNILCILFMIRLTAGTNRLIYYVQKFPFIGSKIPDTVYSYVEGKRAISIVVFILTLLWAILNKFIYAGLFVYLPIIMIGEELSQSTQLNYFFYIYLLISIVTAGLTYTSILEPKREKYIAVKMMRMQPHHYMKNSLCYRYVIYLISYIPALVLFITLLGGTVIQGIVLTIIMTLWRVFSEYYHLKFFEKTEIVLIRQNLFVWITILAGWGLAFVPLFFKWEMMTMDWIVSLPFVLVIVCLGVWAIVKLANYSDYRAVVGNATKRDDPLLNVGQLMVNAQKSAVEIKDNDNIASQVDSQKYEKLKGYHYLNAIFFDRHRQLIIKPLYNKLIAIFVIGIIAIVLALLNVPFVSAVPNYIAIILPFLFVAINFLVVGDKLTMAMFYNSDLQLMRYRYYRKDVFTHFKIRLFKLVKYNFMLAAVLGVILTALFFIGQGTALLDLVCIWVVLLAVSLFFSVHHMFVYYIFQQYSTEQHMKNPFFFFYSMGIGFIASLGILIRFSASVYTLSIIALAVIYTITAYVLVKKIGHRTFRVK